MPTPLAPDLELRLDHRQAVERGAAQRERRRQHLGQRDERDVDHDQVGSVRELAGAQRAGVAALDHGHPRIVAQPPVELAVRHVDGDHVRGAALQQAVGEPTGRGADVEGPAPGDVDASASSALASLIPPRETNSARGDLDLDILGHELPGLLGPAALGQQHHLAREHRRGGAAARREQPALGEQGVEPDLVHDPERYVIDLTLKSARVARPSIHDEISTYADA